MVKKHKKGNPSAGDPGGISEIEAPLHISNVAHFNPAKSKYYKSDNSVVDA